MLLIKTKTPLRSQSCNASQMELALVPLKSSKSLSALMSHGVNFYLLMSDSKPPRFLLTLCSGNARTVSHLHL